MMRTIEEFYKIRTFESRFADHFQVEVIRYGEGVSGREDAPVPSGGPFPVQRIRAWAFGLAGAQQALFEAFDGDIQGQVASLQEQELVQLRSQFADLVGREQQESIVGQVSRPHFAQSHLSRDIQAVGRFVEEEESGAGGEAEGQHHFFLCSEGQVCQFAGYVEGEILEEGKEQRSVEAAVEGGPGIQPCRQGKRGQYDCFRDESDLFEEGG